MPDLRNLRDAMEKALVEYRKEEWDEEKCRCSWPNARPPCGYCESGEYTMDGWMGGGYNKNGFQYETREREKPVSTGKKSALETILGAKKSTDTYEAKYNAALDKIDELEFNLEQLETKTLQAISELVSPTLIDEIRMIEYSIIRKEVYLEIRAAEKSAIREQIKLEVTEDLKKELRKEVLTEMAEANDKI